MLNMLIILFRYKQFASKIYNMYYFLCKLITDLHNSIHFITGLNHITSSLDKIICTKLRTKSFAQNFGSAKNRRFDSVRVRQKFLVRSFPSHNPYPNLYPNVYPNPHPSPYPNPHPNPHPNLYHYILC